MLMVTGGGVMERPGEGGDGAYKGECGDGNGERSEVKEGRKKRKKKR